MFRNILTILVFSALAVFASATDSAAGRYEKATFAGGCFWCMEPPFESLEGVRDVVSGYTGGTEMNPTYEEVSSGRTGHLESVEITFDPAVVSYETLLDTFWRQVNPTDDGGQFVDRGAQYRTAIFYHNSEQKRAAVESKARLESSGIFTDPIVTPILKATAFYPAEEYHQDYYKKKTLRYKFYRYNSGRDQFLKKVWEGRSALPAQGSMKYTRPSDDVLKKRLTALQYRVTQRGGTERPFDNEYWDNKKEGIYVDIVSGEPLFSSTEKFVSGTGWPSFTSPLEPENIVEKEDKSFFAVRTEVRSRYGDSHLGHVFEDGPPPTGLRYCINSAALRFVPREDLEKEGYGEYGRLFGNMVEKTPAAR